MSTVQRPQKSQIVEELINILDASGLSYEDRMSRVTARIERVFSKEEGAELNSHEFQIIKNLVESSRELVLKKVFCSYITGDKTHRPFDEKIRDKAVRILSSFQAKYGSERDERIATTRKDLKEILGLCSKNNNVIDWEQVDRLTDVFQRMQSIFNANFSEI